jgi:hypothetical protein
MPISNDPVAPSGSGDPTGNPFPPQPQPQPCEVPQEPLEEEDDLQ